MKKEIWDWLHPKLCRNSGNHSIKNCLKSGRHARSSSSGLEKRGISSITVHTNTDNASSFSSFRCWSDSRTMSGVDVDVDVDETNGVSGGMETLVIGVLGQLEGLHQIDGVDQEALADGVSFDIQEKPRDLPNHIIQSLQLSDHGHIKEIHCRFSFLADYLNISHRKHRHDASFNVVDTESELTSGNRSSVGRLKRIFSWKINDFDQEAKLNKVRRVFLKKIHHTTKKLGGFLIQNTSKVVDASESLEQKNNYLHSAPTKEEEVYSHLADADYRIMTDSDYVILEW